MNEGSYAAICEIAVHLPAAVVDNAALARELDGWEGERFGEKSGILSRHIAGEDETVASLAVDAAEALFATGACTREDVDFLIVCTQSSERPMPAASCVVHGRLRLAAACGTIDVNQGSSGFVYCLAVAKGLIESGSARNVVVITAETVSRFVARADRAVRPLFGDSATATLIRSVPRAGEAIRALVFGTDGRGAGHLSVRDGVLTMNGSEIVRFALRAVPGLVSAVLMRGGCSLDDIAAFVFHQPNSTLLDQLRRKIGISPEKLIVELEHCGNTASSSIPIALSAARDRGAVRAGEQVLLAGFGAGFSWAGALVRPAWKTRG